MKFEWQFIGDDQWIFGEKIRSIVRMPVAEIYFDEDLDDPRGGWVWFTVIRSKDYDGFRGDSPQGLSASLQCAVADAEEALKREGVWSE